MVKIPIIYWMNLIAVMNNCEHSDTTHADESVHHLCWLCHFNTAHKADT